MVFSSFYRIFVIICSILLATEYRGATGWTWKATSRARNIRFAGEKMAGHELMSSVFVVSVAYLTIMPPPPPPVPPPRVATLSFSCTLQGRDQLRTPREAGLVATGSVSVDDSDLVEQGFAMATSLRQQLALEEKLYFQPSDVYGKRLKCMINSN